MIERNVTEVQPRSARVDARIDYGAGTNQVFVALDGDLGRAATAVAFGDGSQTGIVQTNAAIGVGCPLRLGPAGIR